MAEPIRAGTILFIDEVFDGGQFVRVLIENPDNLEDSERTYSKEEFAELLGYGDDIEDLVEGTRFKFQPLDRADVDAFGHVRLTLGRAKRIDDRETRRQIRRLLREIPLLSPPDYKE